MEPFFGQFFACLLFMSLFYRLINLISQTFQFFIAALLIFEEWGWAPLAKFLSNFIKSIIGFKRQAKVKNWISQLSPRESLIVFFMPVIFVVPVKFLSIYLLKKKQVISAVIVFVLAKLIGTSMLSLVFKLTKNTLCKMPLFNFIYFRWKNWKDTIVSNFKATPFWKDIISLKNKMIRYI